MSKSDYYGSRGNSLRFAAEADGTGDDNDVTADGAKAEGTDVPVPAPAQPAD